MSRPALATWLLAAAVAAFPTWEEWRFRLTPGAFEGFSCIGNGWSEPSPLDPLRGDLDALLVNVEAWTIPPLLILAALLARRNPRRAGRRTAVVLVLIAVVIPATPLYSSPDECGGLIPLFSAEWFTTVLESWGSTQLCLIGAAALILLASWRTSDAPQGKTGVTWRRPVALLVDYLLVVAVLTFVVEPVLWLPGVDELPLSVNVYHGLLNQATIRWDTVDFDGLIVLFVVFLYFWGQHTLWGQTPGKRLLRIQVTPVRAAKRMAVRTLIFPLLVFVSLAGPVVLIVNGMWTLLDPAGRALHDRLLNTEVIRKARSTGQREARVRPFPGQR
ncbi:RDD family protein [Herbidospora sp. NBRC 101105]|uniref:RDD family protein n=1 Tax=Herbidospora sp. NBRC 101105 TaxID=3032195 RepID=UPI002555DD1A|nr:RDD family protein [Herbidospora sp. NBRC 101105]